MSLSILIHVTHLLGSGHLTRAASLASTCATMGHRVTLISGGMPNSLVDHDSFEVVQLPPVRIEGTAFTRLLTETGAEADKAFLNNRRHIAVDVVREKIPDVVITELFPFGRRVLAEEFLAVIDAARGQARPATIIASVRDILASPSRVQRVAETHSRITSLYDAVLVHGDPDIVPLEASWPVDEELRPYLHYTGYIDNPQKGEAVETSAPSSDIVVSGGSSAASLQLYDAALRVAKETEYSWHVLVGNGVGLTDFARLTQTAPANVMVERARPDFRSLLAKATLSVSQCGYNTAVDLLQLPIRRLFVPFEAGHETEQRLRAETLAARGYAQVLTESELSAESLAEAVSNMMLSTPSPGAIVRLNGATESVRLMETLQERAPL